MGKKIKETIDEIIRDGIDMKNKIDKVSLSSRSECLKWVHEEFSETTKEAIRANLIESFFYSKTRKEIKKMKHFFKEEILKNHVKCDELIENIMEVQRLAKKIEKHSGILTEIMGKKLGL